MFLFPSIPKRFKRHKSHPEPRIWIRIRFHFGKTQWIFVSFKTERLVTWRLNFWNAQLENLAKFQANFNISALKSPAFYYLRKRLAFTRYNLQRQISLENFRPGNVCTSLQNTQEFQTWITLHEINFTPGTSSAYVLASGSVNMFFSRDILSSWYPKMTPNLWSQRQLLPKPIIFLVSVHQILGGVVIYETKIVPFLRAP